MATRLERVNAELSEFKVMPISWLTERLKSAGDDKVTENKVYDLARGAGKHIFCVIKGICYYGPKPNAQETITRLSAELPEHDKVDIEAEKQKLATTMTEEFHAKITKLQEKYETMLRENECKKEHLPEYITNDYRAVDVINAVDSGEHRELTTEEFNKIIKAFSDDALPDTDDIPPMLHYLLEAYKKSIVIVPRD